MVARRLHQRQMAIVQIAHGGNKADAAMLCKRILQFDHR
jgi:hypothetical protein